VIHILTFRFEQGADLLVPFCQLFSHTQPFMEILVSHCLVLFLAITWIMTGDPLYLLKPKSKRVGRGLRILSLGAKEHKLKNKQKIKKEKAQKKGLFQIEYFNNEKQWFKSVWLANNCWCDDWNAGIQTRFQHRK
jgi:hypothetical protein